MEHLKELQKGLHLVWHGVNDAMNLKYFLKSDIYWAEGDVRGFDGSLILRHDPFESHPLAPNEELLEFKVWLKQVSQAGRGIQVDLKEGGEPMERMMKILLDARIPGGRLWFTTNLKDVPMEDYARLGKSFPDAVLQSTIPIRFMFQEMSPEERTAWLEINRGLGVSHLSVPWYDEPESHELAEVRSAGFAINLFYVNSLEDMNRAIVLKPDSITSDFHIPEWGLFGRGSGENGFYLEKG